MTTCQHGGIDYDELEMLGIAPQGILDFSANLNPFGPPPKVMQAIYDISHSNLTKAISHYPDSEARSLRHSLADRLRISSQNIIVTSGSTELIRLAALAYFGKGDKVLIIEPTYCEYELACRIAGASVIKQQLSTSNAFLPNIDETIDLIKQYHPKGIFVCNPNNPTGRYLSRADFEMILDAGKDSLVVLDEAYVSFVDSPWSSLDMVEGTNLLILRSMTKDYALAGLRLGYGVARQEIITTLRHVCPPWNVNALAQKAGIIAVVEEAYLERCQSELIEAKNYLMVGLSPLGLPPLPSEAHFFLVKVGNATEFRRELLLQRVLVRDCSSFGLPQYIRIAPRTLPECHILVSAIKEIRKEHHNEQFFIASVKTNKASE
jgi:histidinol-phosphate aminotransferase